MSELFRGKVLQRRLADGSVVESSGEAMLGGKLTALYFANSSKCAQFTQLLQKFCDDLNSTKLEIVYLSDDPDESAMLEGIKSGGISWCFLPFGDPIIFDLIERYDLDTVPVLMVIKADGSPIANATGDIESGKSGPELLAQWESSP